MKKLNDSAENISDIWCDITSKGEVVFYLDENQEACSSASFHMSELDKIQELITKWHQDRIKNCTNDHTTFGSACGCWTCPECGHRNVCNSGGYMFGTI